MIGVIADDLTGAAEIGAVGWCHGLRAEIVRDGEPSGRAELVCIDTDSRSLTVEKAQARAAHAAALLTQFGVRWIYKKVDSVLRGHVVPEVQAILQELKLTSAIILPENPRRGRTIEGGRYLIDGRPIDQTEFRNDPEFPRRNADVHALLGVQKDAVHVCSDSTMDLPHGLVVGEAASSADLQVWAERQASGRLSVGGAEFFEALLGATGLGPRGPISTAAEVEVDGATVFICGTLSPSAAWLIARASQHAVPVFNVPAGSGSVAAGRSAASASLVRDIIDALRNHRTVVMVTPEKIETDVGESRRLSEQLTQVAVEVLSQFEVTSLFVEGGATAAHLVRKLAWNRMQVLRQVAPGVVTLAEEVCGRMRLTIKPGSYHWPEKVRKRLTRDMKGRSQPK